MKKKQSFYNLDETLRQAVEQFSRLDPEDTAIKAGADYSPDKKVLTISFINQAYQISHPDGTVLTADGERASTYHAIIILHYLATATGEPLTGEWIAYRHLPGGDIYIDPFQKRAVNPFMMTFGGTPETFVKKALSVGGRQAGKSGYSVEFRVLPRVPMLFTLWPGDEELPGSATILFDQSAPGYLPTEDYAHLPGLIISAVKKAEV